MKRRCMQLIRMKSRTHVLFALLIVAITPAALYACGRVDLSITKSGPGTATVGQTATYNFIVTQHDTGRSTGTQTEVRDLIPAGFTFASASGVSCSVSGNNVICTGIPNLTQNQSHSFSVTFNVTAAACANSPVTNTAVVDAREADTNPSNDTSNTVTTAINGCDADLSVSKSGDSTVAAGSTVNYSVQVTNGGPSDATNVKVTDAIPSGLSFNSGASDGACSQNGSNVECTASSLANGANKTFAIAFDVPDTQQVCGTNISNQASVSSDTGDTNTSNNTSSTVSTSITCNADLSVTKSGPATIEGGNSISYTVTVANGGPNTAHNVKVTDAIPSGLTFNSGASDGACSQNGSNVECTASSLANGANKTFAIAFDVPASGALCGNSVSNQATVSSDTTDSNSGNNTSQAVSTQVTCSADLSITKSGPGTVTRNSTVSYTIIVTNNGPADAQGVTISDAVPAGVTFNSGASDASCVLNGSNVLCNNITLTNGQSKTVIIAFNVPASAVCNSTVTNQAIVSGSTTDPVSSNNTSSTVASTVDCSSEQADLTLTKTGPATVARGTTISYTLVATNNGPATANAVTITDPVPAGLTFNSAASDAGCALNGTNVLCNSFSLTNGASKTVTVAFDVPAQATCGATIANQASVSTSSIDPVSSNNTSQTVTSTVDCSGEQADLSVTKSGPATVQRGNIVSYTVSVTNGGPATANAVKVTDAIPSGLTFNSGASSPECAVNGSNVECTVSTLTNGASKGFTIAFDVPNSTTCGSSITNQASVSTTSVDPVSSNNTSQTVSTTVNCDNQADLSVTKSGPATITRNSVISYSVTATNNGPGTATSVVISDAVPTGLTFNSGASDLSCVLNGSNVLCNGFNLASGQSRTVTIAFNVPAGATCGGTIANVASVASAVTDPVSSNNTSQTVSTTIDCSSENADVRITKTGPSTVLKGGTLSYTLNVTNGGPATAQGVTISDPVPSGLTFNPSASSPNCILNGSNVLCNNIALANGQTQSVIIAFNVPTTATCGALYTNQATVSSSSTDPVSSNNTSQTVTTTVDCPPVHSDLEVVKAGRDRIPRTETLIYMIQVLNRGPDEAPDVQVRDTIPAGLVFNPGQSHPACQQVGNEIVCNGPALPKDRQWAILVAFDLSASVQCGSFIQNRARASTTAIDPNSANDQSQLVATFVECPNGNMTIEKSGPTTVLRGNTITYNIVVRNTSPTEVLRNTLVFDQTPANTTFLDAQSTPGCFIGVGFTDVYCPAQDVPVGGTRNVTLVFRVENTAACDSFINNIADVWADNADATWSNEVITQVQCLSTETDISVDKTGPGTVTRGNQISYSITVTNHGLGDATGVQIADPIPNGLTFVSGSSSNNCSVNGAEIVCGNIDLVNGQSRTLTLVFTVPSSVACNSTLQNQARLLLAPQGDPNPNNNVSNVISTTVNCPAQTADLRVSKSGPASVVKGNTVTYTLVATNDGPDTATNVTIADPIPTVPHETTNLPVQLTFLSGSSDASCVSNGTDILCNNFNLASGQSRTVTVAFSVPTTTKCASTIVNRASVSASSTDPNSSNNQSQQVSTAVDCVPSDADVSVTKSGPATVTRGNVLTYSLTASNAGPVSATNVTITDTVPTGLVFNAGASGGNCSLSGNTISCAIGTLASGASQSVSLAFNTPATLTCNSQVQNYAVIAALQPDPNNSNNTTNTVTTTILCPVAQADVTVSKTGPATILRGTKITYTLTATNNGPDAATNVVITDPIPSAQHESSNTPLALQFEAGDSDPSCAINGVNVECSGFSLNPSQSKTVQVTFTVPSQSRCSAFVVNQASVVSGANDPNSANNLSQITSTLIQCPVTDADLSITKVGQQTVLRGNRVSYNITVTNNGPATATNVTIADPIPTVLNEQAQGVYLTFDPVASDSSCQINGINVLCNNFSLTAGQSKTVTLAFTVPTVASCNANIVNFATVSASSTDPISSNNTSQTVHTTVQCPVEQSDLTIAKMGRDRIPIGETLLYTLQAFNRGPSTATNVTFRDQIPAGLVFNPSQSDSSCQKVGNEILCTRATLAESQLWTIVIGFDINPQTVQCNSFLSNVATLSSDQTDPDPSTNTSNTVQTYVECPGGEISIVKSGPATTLRGANITYNILVTNNSAFTVREASVFDGTPQNTTFVPNGSSPECYVAPGFTDVFCAPTDLAPGQQRTVTLVFKVNDNAPCNSTLNNIADVWSDNADPTWSNEVVTQVMCPPASFSITKTDNRTTVTAGEVLTYQISVTNTSSVNDSNVHVTDTLPANVTFVGASDGGIFDGTQVQWNGLSINAGETKVLLMTVSVNAGTPNGTILTNNAFVVNGPTAIDQTTVIENITFTISKDDGRTNANAGETLIYTIPVTNTSATNATNATVTDTLPPQVTFVSADNSGTHSNGTVTWSGLSIAAGQTKNLMVTVTINPATPGGTVLTNTATILGGPSAVDTTIVNGGQLGCIEIIKETFDTNGQPITPVAQFMFSLDNGSQTTQNDSSGHARFDNVAVGSHTVTETVPPTWSQLSVTPPSGVLQVQSGPVCSTVTFKNQQQLQNSTFTITKTDNRTTVSPGETLIYTIDVKNTSAVNAANVSVRDTLPADLTFVSANSNGTHTAGVVDWVVPINAGQTVQFTVNTTVKVATANGTVLENTAQVLGGPSTIDTTTVVTITSSGCIDVVKETFDINGHLITPVPQFSFQLDGGAQSTVSNSLGLARFNNVPTGTHTVSETVPPTWRQVSITPPNGLVVVSQGPTCSTVLFKNQQDLGGPEFAMSKTDGRSTAAPGETLTYTITVENISNKNATGVTVLDTLPTNVTFVSADSGGVHSNGTITWNNISVNANSSVTLTVIAQVNANVANGTVITNTAGIPNVITVADTTTVSTQVPTFSISKTDNLATATPGQSLTYLITVQNTSAFNATNVSVTDTLPSQVIYNGSSDNGSVNGQIVTWSGLSIAAGQQKTLTVTATVNGSTPNGTVVTNIAQVVNGPSATDITTIQGGQPLLTISKTDNRTTAKVNEILTYVITMQNSTSVTATNVGVTDTLPGDVTFVSATNGGTANGQTVTWGNLTINGSSTISLTVQARVNSAVPDNTILTNTAQIVGGLSATDTTTVEGGTPDPNNVTIDLSDDRDPVDPGESFCYTIQVNNLNSAELTNQTVTQTLDGMTEYQSASDNGSHSSRIITWRNVTLPGNGTKTFNSCVKVDEDTELDELLTSKAFINSKSDTENTRVGEGFITGNNRCEIQSISDTPDPVKIGETLTYSIRVRNGRNTSSTSTTSSNSARSFDIVAYLDNDTTFMSASNGGDENGGREVEWNDIRLRRGESESVRVTVRVKDSAAREDQLRIRVQCEDDEEYENTRVEGEGEPPTDGQVRVSIDKRASTQEARPGDMVNYTLTLRNLTNRAAKDVTVEDRFNAGSISIQDAGGGEIAGNGIDWKVPNLGPNDTRIFTYRVRVGPDMRHGQIISNTVVVRSPDLDRPATDTEEVRIITELPQTGGGGFGSSFTDVAQNLRPTGKSIQISSSNGAAAMQFILWTSIISMGMIGGTLLGKRFFL
ncbi:hypothetical protein COU78_02635 [Candidatus Peregrinibacteria bacterium CG10_big_fil_rev_8_21_14_0_10_49_24]|nr:MAG: hypothetical protein COV83_02615 [Candidatus Peregrinibacteria bacterium CG11_big_fil_rev_8_21_14_0_20_49_14]PIR51033.1 MAG: hypothetical protein COU78_02635 [Candidatus Peregrinibacteria bacterium CG10_big_fil_rev_8_21_14_0_10_49_24]PJA67586.1 MAG: hypothetical protein CO157_04115 [Candidatus Peregrinibacteria bacterium CG_4_9_14_3_um_filter_49_12]